ncbi:Reverse transcriptase domain, partial [Cinara cedri]
MEKDDEKFFYEDEVAMVSPKSGLVKYGLVLTTNRSRSENELMKSVYNNFNEIKVIWHPNGAEEIIPDDKVVLMDRSLMPGDVVRKVSEGKPSQFGYCENINIYATVKILNTNKIIENISSRNFTHTKSFAIDSSVFYESWVGGVYDVKCKVTFASQDGSIFTLEDPYRQDFISLSTSDSFSIDDNVFYPGQKLKMCLDSFENAKFIRISNLMSCLWHNYKKKYNYKFVSKWVKVYVQDIAVSSVEVEWYCQTTSKIKGREENWPERIITGDNLKKLKTIDLFESCSIQVGDTHWYTIKDTDNLITMKQWRNKCTETFNTAPDLMPSLIKKETNYNKLLGTLNVSNENISSIKIRQIEKPSNKDKCMLQSKKSEPKPSTSTISTSSIHTLKSNRLKRNRMWKLLVKKNKQFNVPKVSTKPNSKVVVEICYTQSMIDVIWTLSLAYKILAYCILDRIKPLSEGVLGQYQGGFRPNRTTTDQIFCIRQIAQNSWEYNKELYILFIDFEKAYDSIHRSTLINILKEFNFPIKLVNLIKASLENTLIKIKIANAVSETVRVSTSLTQGNALSPVLFNLVLEKIVRGLNTIDGVAMGNTTIDLLAYADGLAFLGNNLDTVKQNCRKLINVAGKRGLKINDKKTKNVIIGRRSRKYQQGEFMEIDNHKFKRA